MRIALIRDGFVENVIEAEESYVPSDEGVLAIPSVQASRGWTYDGSSFHEPVILPPIPDEISLWQVRALLKLIGKFDQAESLVNGSNDESLIAYWNYGNVMHRNSPTLSRLAGALDISAATLDNLFRQASSLSV